MNKEKIWFTSDNHFGHKSILKFAAETRMNLTDVDEMNERMIEIWNNTVGENDRVYTLGDFSFLKSEKTVEIIKRLNGRLFLIKGNHDHWLNEENTEYFEGIYDYKKITIDGKKVILFHYPIAEFENMHHGAYHFHGHTHGNYHHSGRGFDVGIDNRPQKDMGLWSWDELVDIMEKKPILPHHGKIVD